MSVPLAPITWVRGLATRSGPISRSVRQAATDIRVDGAAVGTEPSTARLRG
jgi:hypothetical protein